MCICTKYTSIAQSELPLTALVTPARVRLIGNGGYSASKHIKHIQPDIRRCRRAECKHRLVRKWIRIVSEERDGMTRYLCVRIIPGDETGKANIYVGAVIQYTPHTYTPMRILSCSCSPPAPKAIQKLISLTRDEIGKGRRIAQRNRELVRKMLRAVTQQGMPEVRREIAMDPPFELGEHRKGLQESI